MPVIADYSIIRDTSFTIQTGGDIDRTFDLTLPSSLYRSNRGVLAYITDPYPNANNLRVEILVNGTSIRKPRFSGDSYQTLHEVVDSNLLKVGNNTFKFRITSGSGKILISDIVLWWQRSI